MKNKILVIFFISFLFSSIIYKFTLSNNKYILILGDNYFKSSYTKDSIYFLLQVATIGVNLHPNQIEDILLNNVLSAK